jgi:hypothetical protein
MYEHRREQAVSCVETEKKFERLARPWFGPSPLLEYLVKTCRSARKTFDVQPLPDVCPARGRHFFCAFFSPRRLIRGKDATSMFRSLVPLVCALATLLCGCEDRSAPVSTQATAPTSASAPAPLASFIAPSPPVAPASGSLLPNPLGLASRHVTLDAGRRVFTFSESMLSRARLGSTLVLYAATVAGLDGEDLVIEGQAGGTSYKVGGAYVIPVPDGVKPKANDVVLTEWNGVMKHALVKRYVKDRVAVKFTDVDGRAPETLLKGVRWVVQTEGLMPGNYAAYKQDGELRHVLLVSRSEDPEPRWFCLGFGGSAMVVNASDLVPIPIKWKGKPGATVLAEWAGTMRKAVLQTENEPGVFTVKFERAGKPETVGYGMIMNSP